MDPLTQFLFDDNRTVTEKKVNFPQFIKTDFFFKKVLFDIDMRTKTKSNVPLVFPLSPSICAGAEARFPSFAVAAEKEITHF